MAATALEPPDRVAALRSCRAALRRVAGYTIDPGIDLRMLDLGERKEALSQAEYAELMALAAFSQQRSLEKLDAELALRRLDAAYPDLAAEA
jgi:outer membrane protein TolC